MRTTIVRIAALLLAIATSCARGGRGLVAVDDDVVRDARTGLEWTRHDHDRPLAWDDADRHCRELALGTRRDWRLPELAELEALYDPHQQAPCGDRTCHLDPAIRLGGPYIWTASQRGPGTRFYFDAGYGTSFSPGTPPTLVRRVLCVRKG